MSAKLRSYIWPDDFAEVGRFLIDTYVPGGRYPNWLRPRWEYMHFHPYLRKEFLDRIGIWKDSGRIVAVVNYEDRLGDAYFSVHRDYGFLKGEMLDHAEKNLDSIDSEGRRYLRVFSNDFDSVLNGLLIERGYLKDESNPEEKEISALDLTKELPETPLPDGFKLKSLEEDNDLRKVDKALWRGFNHPGEVRYCMDDRKLMQTAPNYEKSLNIVVEAPDGEFVSYAGIWHVPENRMAYVEPVATDPDYRRMGLGKAAVIETARRCKALGDETAIVETGKKFYKSMGFVPFFRRFPWTKFF